MNTRAFGFEELSVVESREIQGGEPLTVAAVAVAVAIAGLFVTAFAAGYQAGAAAAQ